MTGEALAAETRAQTVTLDDMVARARELGPRLRERAEQTEQLRHLPSETVDEFRRAGLFKLFQPARYGGYELDYGLTQVRLAGELGPACGSSTWTLLVTACHSWIVGMFRPEVQDAVWGDDPDVLVASSFTAGSGIGKRVDGGYRLEGEWLFSSGSDLSDWIVLGTPVAAELAVPPRPWRLAPRAQRDILDTWHGRGRRGTSS